MSDKTVPTILVPCQVPDDLIPHFLPGGGISILAGAPNVGKTALLASLLKAFQTGAPIFGRTPRVVQWGYINSDRGWDKGAGLWLRRAGVELAHYSLADDPSFSPKRLRRKWERVDVLASLIDKLSLPRDSGVIVDPMSLFLGGNLLDYDACMCACMEIRAYIRDRGYTILGLAHSGKMKADKSERYVRTSDQILGSTAISGFSDAILHLASPEELDEPYYQLSWHPHGAQAERYLLERDDQGLFVPYVQVTEKTRRQAVLQAIPTTGEAVPLPTIIAAAAGLPCSTKTVKRILVELIEEGIIVKVQRGWYRRATH